MDNFVERVSLPQGVQAGGVQDIAINEGDPFGQVAEEMGHQGVGGQHVVADHLVAAGGQFLNNACPDEADAAGYQGCHG